jgi:hypothetical protein
MMERTRLAAYVDGSLEPEEAAKVVMHLADNPDDRAFVDCITELNDLLVSAYESPANQPVPGQIRATIFPPQPAAAGLWSRIAGYLARPAPLAAFAAAALFAAVVVDWSDPPPPGIEAGVVPADSVLQTMLETRPSGDAERIGGATVTLIAVFLDAENRPCREYELQHGSGEVVTRGIACRNETDGAARWEIEMTASHQIGRFGNDRTDYVPAQGPAQVAVSTANEKLGAGPSLSAAEEQALIANGWH